MRILLCFLLLATRLSAAPAPDYAHATGMGPLLHWARMPVRVRFAPGGAATPERVQAARAGFNEWALMTLDVIRCQVVDDPQKADLVVRFDPAAFVPGHPGAVGHTELTHADSVLVAADMTLATGGAAAADLTQTAAHEFGHALGINGHSDDPADMMYPSTTRLILPDGTALPAPPRLVTTRDLNTLWLCYPALRPRPAAPPGKANQSNVGKNTKSP